MRHDHASGHAVLSDVLVESQQRSHVRSHHGHPSGARGLGNVRRRNSASIGAIKRVRARADDVDTIASTSSRSARLPRPQHAHGWDSTARGANAVRDHPASASDTAPGQSPNCAQLAAVLISI